LGRAVAQIHEPERVGNCRRGRLRIGTLLQSRVQTAVWPPTGPLPEPITGGAAHLAGPDIIQAPTRRQESLTPANASITAAFLDSVGDGPYALSPVPSPMARCLAGGTLMPSGRRPHSWHPASSLPLIGLLLIGICSESSASLVEQFVTIATYDGVINPVAAEYLHDALASAEADKAQALVIALNTPGGLDSSMRLIIKDITGATIPVVVYVWPSSGRAASAGVFITMAAHVAAMAPGTHIGAAHPVNMGGGEMDKTMKEKIENDSVAYIKSIAQQHKRNAAWAEDAVRKS